MGFVHQQGRRLALVFERGELAHSHIRTGEMSNLDTTSIAFFELCPQALRKQGKRDTLSMAVTW